MGFFSTLFGRQPRQLSDAQKIYDALMRQSRDPAFFGANRMSDSYDGRIELLTLHISCVLSSLRRFDKNGQLLSQAIYDVMRDDFDVALREEGLSDTGVSRRIKPMMSIFFTRIRDFEGAMTSDAPVQNLSNILQSKLDATLPDAFAMAMADYAHQYRTHLTTLSLGEIALAQFAFPDLPQAS